MKWIIIEVADHDAEGIEFNDKHGNSQVIADASHDHKQFDVIAVVKPGSIAFPAGGHAPLCQYFNVKMHPGGALYVTGKCGAPAVYRHREHDRQAWLYRCATHERALSREIMIERL